MKCPKWSRTANNSTDSTAQIFTRYLNAKPTCRTVFEPRQGATASRNRAVANASGDYIASIDWDTEVRRAKPGLFAIFFADFAEVDRRRLRSKYELSFQ